MAQARRLRSPVENRYDRCFALPRREAIPMPNKAARETTTPLELEQIGDRYEVVELLGRGGMACVYRVKDRVTGNELALKQLLVERGAAERSVVASLFEREFHT
jgi:serine/threonine protein kinase